MVRRCPVYPMRDPEAGTASLFRHSWAPTQSLALTRCPVPTELMGDINSLPWTQSWELEPILCESEWSRGMGVADPAGALPPEGC